MPFIQTSWWSAEFPDEWSVEEDGGTVTLTDPDDIGALDFTAIVKEAGVVSAVELDAMANESFPQGAESHVISIGGIEGKAIEYLDEGDAWREWILADENILLYVTYNCDDDDKGIDDAVVDQILSTLAIEPNEYIEETS